jgi:Phosphoesterase family
MVGDDAIRMRRAASMLVGVLLAAGASACGGGSSANPDTLSTTAPASSQHVSTAASSAHGSAAAPRIVVVFMENQNYANIEGNPCCPYETGLASGGLLLSNFYGVAYPSRPNYLAFAGGSTFGQSGNDYPLPVIPADNLFQQLSTAGISWAAWAEDYPGSSGNCSLAPTAPNYAMRHVAPLLFADVADTSLCDNVTAVEPRTLPSFLWVTPDMCNDDHDCNPATGDQWLAAHVPDWLDQGAEVFITYDTGNPDHTNGGGHVFAVLAGRGIAHRVDGTTMNDYSALAGIERAYHLPLLRGAAPATPVPF